MHKISCIIEDEEEKKCLTLKPDRRTREGDSRRQK